MVSVPPICHSAPGNGGESKGGGLPRRLAGGAGALVEGGATADVARSATSASYKRRQKLVCALSPMGVPDKVVGAFVAESAKVALVKASNPATPRAIIREPRR
jgi:hypothetical protein